MDVTIERIHAENYGLFDDMTFRREHGYDREPGERPVPEAVRVELENPNLRLYSAKIGDKYVGWISLVYIPKVSRWKGHGHVYVDELWVDPDFRGQGIAKRLMQQADRMLEEWNAVGVRLYVNRNNPGARKLYEQCGFQESGEAYFMEKER